MKTATYQLVSFSFVTRRHLEQAMEHCARSSGDAPGPDRKSHDDVFGSGRPGDPVYRETYRRLAAIRHEYKLSKPRPSTVRGRNGKRRRVLIPSFSDRVVLHGATLAIREMVPVRQANVARSGLDARFSVARVALAMRTADDAIPYWIRSDLSNAFMSLDWRSVLASQHSAVLDVNACEALRAIYSLYSPTGIGVPLGIPTSPLMLDLACMMFDEKVVGLGAIAHRYMDDLLVLGDDPELGDKVLDLISRELAPFGLRCNEAKTKLQDCHRSTPSRSNNTIVMQPTRLNWLGYELARPGVIDVEQETAIRLLALSDDKRRNAEPYFGLARQGQRFSAIFGPLHDRQVDQDRQEAAKAEDPRLEHELFQDQHVEDSPHHLWQPPLWGAQGDVHQIVPLVHEEVGQERRKIPSWKAGKRITPSTSSPTGTHPTNAPGDHQSRPIRFCNTADECSGGLGRGGWSKRREPHPPRPDRSGVPQRPLDLFGGLPGLLRLAAAWERTACGSERHVRLEANVLFGLDPPKVKQLAIANQYWSNAKEVFWGRGAEVSPGHEPEILEHVWSVLLAAASVTQADAIKFCVADPLEILLERLGGESATRCKRLVDRERRARSRGQAPHHISLWGRLTLNSASDFLERPPHCLSHWELEKQRVLELWYSRARDRGQKSRVVGQGLNQKRAER